MSNEEIHPLITALQNQIDRLETLSVSNADAWKAETLEYIGEAIGNTSKIFFKLQTFHLSNTWGENLLELDAQNELFLKKKETVKQMVQGAIRVYKGRLAKSKQTQPLTQEALLNVADAFVNELYIDQGKPRYLLKWSERNGFKVDRSNKDQLRYFLEQHNLVTEVRSHVGGDYCFKISSAGAVLLSKHEGSLKNYIEAPQSNDKISENKNSDDPQVQSAKWSTRASKTNIVTAIIGAALSCLLVYLAVNNTNENPRSTFSPSSVDSVHVPPEVQDTSSSAPKENGDSADKSNVIHFY